MTDFHSMTDQKLNEWIATRRDGWSDNHWSAQFILPTYCNNWHRAGELLDEMRENNLHVVLSNRFKSNCGTEIKNGHYENDAWLVAITSAASIHSAKYEIYVTSNCPTRAIAEAYAVWCMTKTDGSITVGDTVTILVHGAGYTTEEEAEVTSIGEHGEVYLDNGNEPYINGKRTGIYGFWLEIKDVER